jgi:hypothetical protein
MNTDITLLFIGPAYVGKTTTCASILTSMGVNHAFGIIQGNHLYSQKINMATCDIKIRDQPVKLQLIEIPIFLDDKTKESVIDILKKGVTAVILVDNMITIRSAITLMPYSSKMILTNFFKLCPKELAERVAVITTCSSSVIDAEMEDRLLSEYCKSLHKELKELHPTIEIFRTPVSTFDNDKLLADLQVDTVKFLEEIATKWRTNITGQIEQKEETLTMFQKISRFIAL